MLDLTLILLSVMGEDKTVELMGQGKDQVEVAGGQKLRGLLLKPFGLGKGISGSGGYGRSYRLGAQSRNCRTSLDALPALGYGRPKRPVSPCAEKQVRNASCGSSPRTDEKYRPARCALLSLLPPPYGWPAA